MKAVGINAQNQPVGSAEAVAVRLQFPQPVGPVVLPLAEFAYNCAKFSWNGDCEKPTIRPLVVTKSAGAPQGSWWSYAAIEDGNVTFLEGTTHNLAGLTLELRDVPERTASPQARKCDSANLPGTYREPETYTWSP